MENIKEKNFISAIIYCYNDANTIKHFLECLNQVLFNNFLKYEIIIVNDGSTDNSIDIIRQYFSSIKSKAVSILNMSYHQGLEASMNAGRDLSIGDFVYEFDSAYIDFDLNMVMNVYYHSLEGFDIVSASRQLQSKLSSRLFYSVFNKYAKLQYEIGSETFRILSRRAINRINSITQSIPYRKAAYANCGLAISTIKYNVTSPIIIKKNTERNELAMDSLILFTDVAYRVTVGLAILMAILIAAFAIYALVYKFLENPVEGWTTTIIFIAFGFFGLFIILAMVIKYLQTLVTLAFRKKEYLFESIEKLQ